jgi:hypothetical protein
MPSVNFMQNWYGNDIYDDQFYKLLYMSPLIMIY